MGCKWLWVTTVGDGEKVCDAKPILRRHLIAFLLDLYLVHRQLHPSARGSGGRNSSTSVQALLVSLDDFVFGFTSSGVSNCFCAARSSPFSCATDQDGGSSGHRPLTLYRYCVSERQDGPLPIRADAVEKGPSVIAFAIGGVVDRFDERAPEVGSDSEITATASEVRSSPKSRHTGGNRAVLLRSRRGPLRLCHARLSDQRMQSLDCGLAALHRNKHIYRMRRQNIFVDDDPVLLQNFNRLKW